MNSEIISVTSKSGERSRLRWYKVFLIQGYHERRKNVIGDIQTLITKNNLSEHIPFMHIEQTSASSINSYIFLLIKSEILYKLPPELDRYLIQILDSKQYRLNVQFPKYLDFRYYDEIIGFLKKERKQVKNKLEIYNFGITIPYKPVVPTDDPNPFNLEGDLSTAIADSLPPENYDLLLYWLSSLGSGLWESFRAACKMLQIPEPKRVLRRLKLLGHIETSADGSRWSGTPIALVSVEASQPNSQEFILCGQRISNLLDILGDSTFIEYLEQPQGDAPLCIRVRLGADPEAIDQLVEVLRDRNIAIQNVGNASLKFAEALPNWQEWMQTLPRISAPILGYNYEYYDIQQARFIECNFPNITGMYQLTHQKLSQLSPHVCFFDKASDRWFQGDWYGLRFLALQYSDQRLRAKYDCETNNLYIPWSQRWAEIYERALVLSSGCLPSEVKTNHFGRTLQYQNVQAEVAELLANKLNINLN
jgi:hypothetical protein